jgi:hypothetical protein
MMSSIRNKSTPGTKHPCRRNKCPGNGLTLLNVLKQSANFRQNLPAAQQFTWQSPEKTKIITPCRNFASGIGSASWMK